MEFDTCGLICLLTFIKLNELYFNEIDKVFLKHSVNSFIACINPKKGGWGAGCGAHPSHNYAKVLAEQAQPVYVNSPISIGVILTTFLG